MATGSYQPYISFKALYRFPTPSPPKIFIHTRQILSPFVNHISHLSHFIPCISSNHFDSEFTTPFKLAMSSVVFGSPVSRLKKDCRLDWTAIIYPAPTFHMECKYSMESTWIPCGICLVSYGI